MDIFTLSNKLMLGNLIQDFKDYPTFTSIKSVFKSGLYNFISPTASAADFDWQLAKNIITEQRKDSFQFSYYLSKGSNYQDFQKILSEKGFTCTLEDRYLINTIEELYEEDFEEFILIDESLFNEFLRVSAICFPDWETNNEFCKVLFTTQKSQNSTTAKNYLIKKGDRFVGVCSCIFSTKLNLSYQTNIGTIPESRGQGIQKRAIKYLCNQVLKDRVTSSYTIVEPDSISYANYLKVGFKEAAAYDIFSK